MGFLFGHKYVLQRRGGFCLDPPTPERCSSYELLPNRAKDITAESGLAKVCSSRYGTSDIHIIQFLYCPRARWYYSGPFCLVHNRLVSASHSTDSYLSLSASKFPQHNLIFPDLTLVLALL